MSPDTRELPAGLRLDKGNHSAASDGLCLMEAVAYIAGFTAPPGKTMGHAGAIISGSSGTAQGKKDALEARGIQVGTTPTETAQLAAELTHS